MSTVCLNIDNSTVSVIIFGAVAAMVSAIAAILNMSCPFISTMVQNRTGGKGRINLPVIPQLSLSNGESLPGSS